MAHRTAGVFAYSIAAIAGILGIGSLLLFGLFLWTGAFGLFDFRMSQRSLLIFDAGLCLLFFVQHSGMVRRSFRTLLSKVAPGYSHAVIYTISSAAALLLLVGIWQKSSGNIYVLDGVERWLLRGVLLLALAGVVWGIRSLREFDAFGIEALLAHFRREQLHPNKLTIEGPYRLVRHPFYCLGIVALWASPVLSLDRLLLNSLFTVWIVLGATLEERDLAAAFGEDYQRYQRTVPMLLPRRPAS